MVNFFIQRPVFASALAAILVLSGLVCYRLLPVAQFPEITPPQVVVSSAYPGASASDIEMNVSKPLENVLNSVSDLKHITSQSRENISHIPAFVFWL